MGLFVHFYVCAELVIVIVSVLVGSLVVEFEDEIAEKVLALAPAHGAAPNPVGCESKYEFVPMFYRISATFREKDPSWQQRMIRINVMRAGADTVIRILRELVEAVYES